MKLAPKELNPLSGSKLRFGIQAVVSLGLVIGGILLSKGRLTNPFYTNPPAVGAGFSGERVLDKVVYQVSLGPRVPGTKSHELARDWIEKESKALGAKVEIQSFVAQYGFELPSGQVERRPMKAWNIQASLFPEKQIRVLLAAHWDTRFAADKDVQNYQKPGDGAMDGASGVAFLLELGRALIQSKLKPEFGIDLLFLDAEDQGGAAMSGLTPWCLGSLEWAKQFKAQGMPVRYRYGILFDMVGAKGSQYPREAYSLMYAPATVAKVWNVARELKHEKIFPNLDAMAVTDDHVHINQIAGIPMIDLIDLRQNPSGEWNFPDFHHTHRDRPDLMDVGVVQALGDTIMTVLLRDKND